jgi:hypothetical protein
MFKIDRTHLAMRAWSRQGAASVLRWASSRALTGYWKTVTGPWSADRTVGFDRYR